jgi:hypothetical protein
LSTTTPSRCVLAGFGSPSQNCAASRWMPETQLGYAGTDFRGVKLKRCVIRGSPLDDVLGVECLRGIAMPWSDIVASAGAIAAALGITVEPH